MVKLTIPTVDKILFSTHLEVRVYDLNYGNHLGNDSLVSLIHEARVRFLKHYQFTEIDIGGVGILVTALAVKYKAEAFYGDEITIDIGIGDISKTSLDIHYQLKRQDNLKIIADAVTTVTFFDYKHSKVVRVPGIFLEAIQL